MKTLSYGPDIKVNLPPPLNFSFLILLTLYCRKWKKSNLSKTLNIKSFQIEMSTFWNIQTPTSPQFKLQSENPLYNITEAIISEDLCISYRKAHRVLHSTSLGFCWSTVAYLSFLSKIQIMFDIFPPCRKKDKELTSSSPQTLWQWVHLTSWVAQTSTVHVAILVQNYWQ